MLYFIDLLAKVEHLLVLAKLEICKVGKVYLGIMEMYSLWQSWNESWKGMQFLQSWKDGKVGKVYFGKMKMYGWWKSWNEEVRKVCNKFKVGWSESWRAVRKRMKNKWEQSWTVSPKFQGNESWTEVQSWMVRKLDSS